MPERLDRLRARASDHLASFESTQVVLQSQRKHFVETFQKLCEIIQIRERLEKQIKQLEAEMKLKDANIPVLPKITTGDFCISGEFLKATAKSLGVKVS